MTDRPRDQFLDLPEGDPLSTERIDEQVQIASQQEHALKRQLEAVERQKRELEEMGRRQDALNAGRNEMVEKLTRALVVLEREVFEARKRVELLDSIQGSFAQHLEILESVNPKAWEGLDITKELTRALGSVDDARAEYSKSYSKIGVSGSHDASGDGTDGYGADSGTGDAKDFVGWLKVGLAFSLPIIVFGILALVVIVSRLK